MAALNDPSWTMTKRRLRVDLYPPTSTNLKKEAQKQNRSVSNMAAVILDEKLKPDARPKKQ